MTPILEIADEIVDVINDASLLDTGVEAVKDYNPAVDLTDLTSQRCIVYPAGTLSQKQHTRDLLSFEYKIEILLQEKLTKPRTEAWVDRIDELTELAEAIASLFRGSIQLTITKAYAQEVSVDPIFAVDHLDRMNVFTSVITITLNQVRTR